jgi:hypothetical protein
MVNYNNPPLANPGALRFANDPSLFEVQRNCNFEFIVTDLDNIKRAGATGAETDAYISNAQEMLRLSVTSAFIPHFKQDPVAVKRGNSTIKYAGVPSFDAGTLEFNDFVGADTKSILMAWQNLSYNVETELVGSMANPNGKYKKDCYLIEYTPDYRKIRTWLLKGCWISKLSEGEYSAEDGGKHAITATIQYDYAKIDLTDSV